MHDEIIGFIFILSLVCLIVGSIHAGFLKRKSPNKRGYIWGYFVGYSSALLGGLPLLALLIAAPSDTKIEVSIIFGLLWCCAMLASGIGIIKRKRWAWITRICLWPNPLSIIINSIYFLNRKEEFKIEKNTRIYNLINKYTQPSQTQTSIPPNPHPIETGLNIVGLPNNQPHTPTNYSNKGFKWYYLLWIIPIMWFTMYLGIILYGVIVRSVEGKEQKTRSAPLTWNIPPQLTSTPQTINALLPTPTTEPNTTKEEKPILDEEYQPPVHDRTKRTPLTLQDPKFRKQFEISYQKSLNDYFSSFLKNQLKDFDESSKYYFHESVIYGNINNDVKPMSREDVMWEHIKLIEKYPAREHTNIKVLSTVPIFPPNSKELGLTPKTPLGVSVIYEYDYKYAGLNTKKGKITAQLKIEYDCFIPLQGPIWTKADMDAIVKGGGCWGITEHIILKDMEIPAL